MAEFKKDTFGVPEVQVIRFTRKQIESMYEMVSKFDDVDDFELHVSDNGLNFKFTLALGKETK